MFVFFLRHFLSLSGASLEISMAHKSNASEKCLYTAFPLWSFTKQDILVRLMWRPLILIRDCPGLNWNGVNFFLFACFIIIHSFCRCTSERSCYLQLLKKYWLKVRLKVQCTHIYARFFMILENNNWICELKSKFLYFKQWHKWHEMGIGTCFMSVIFNVFSKMLLLLAFCHF